jgi:hypothetical protein
VSIMTVPDTVTYPHTSMWTMSYPPSVIEEVAATEDVISIDCNELVIMPVRIGTSASDFAKALKGWHGLDALALPDGRVAIWRHELQH